MKQERYNNPVLPGFYPDPSICRAGSDYYMVNSTFGYFPGIPIFHSKDLIHWEQIGNVLDRKSQIPLENTRLANDGIYAPTIRYNNGIFYVITTNVRGGNGNFIVTADNPAGPWSEPVCLGSEGIDPSLFFDDDGRCYYCGTKDRREGARYFGDNEIYIQELDLDTMKLTGESWAAWHGALRNVEWPEGPHIYKKDGWYYLMISEAGTAHMHCVTVARSRSLREPFTGYPGNPILTHRNLGINYPIVNVGHPDIVETDNGEWWMVLLASRPYGGYYRNLGRETFLVPMTWENGWPLINPGKAIVEDTVPAPNLPECEYEPVPDFDDFNYDTLPFHYMYVRNPKPEMYSLTDRKGYMRLTLSPNRINTLSSPTLICRRQTDMSYELETLLDFKPSDGEEAGLVLLHSDSNYYTFTLTGGASPSLKVMKCYEKNGKNIEEEVILHELNVSDMTDKGIYLKVVQNMQNISFSYSFDRKNYICVADNADGRILCTDMAGGFVGTCLGIFATSNGSPSDNYADFDFLSYKGL